EATPSRELQSCHHTIGWMDALCGFAVAAAATAEPSLLAPSHLPILRCSRLLQRGIAALTSARMGLMQDLHGYYLEDLSVGMTAVYAKTVTDADVVLFAGVSGDVNPVHLNQEFAERTMFRGRIAHGMLTASFISTVLGTKLPGPGCIYISQNLKFK